MASPRDTVLPPALRRGDTIALISPSWRLNRLFTKAHLNSITALETLGYRVKTIFSDIPAESTHKQKVQHRARELHSAFADPEVRAVVCTAGGKSANELLPELDYDLIRAHPKIFVGFSDITVLALALYTAAGLRTFYGPMSLWQFGETPRPLDFTAAHFQRTLGGTRDQDAGGESLPRSATYTTTVPNVFAEGGAGVRAAFAGGLASVDLSTPRPQLPAPGWRWLRAGRCQGRLVGGTLGSLRHLAGTRWWPSMEGAILLLERDMDDGDAVADLLASLTDLANLGVFAQCAGVVWARSKVSEDLDKEREKGDMMRAKAHRALLDVLDAVDFRGPVLADVDTGHTDPILTLAIGAMYALDSDADQWRLVEDVVRT